MRELLDIVNDRPWDEYALLRSSAIVRALLLDDAPLLHQVNRQRRRRIQFAVFESYVSAEILKDKPFFYSVGSGLSPRLSIVTGTVTTLNLDQFLKYRVTVVADRRIDVQTVVKFLANVAGGVHPGTPKTELEALLGEANDGLGIGGVGSIAASMQGIADVVATACEPLTS